MRRPAVSAIRSLGKKRRTSKPKARPRPDRVVKATPSPKIDWTPYLGQCVALSQDLSHVVASASDLNSLGRLLRKRKIDTNQVVFDFVDDGEFCDGVVETL